MIASYGIDLLEREMTKKRNTEKNLRDSVVKEGHQYLNNPMWQQDLLTNRISGNRSGLGEKASLPEHRTDNTKNQTLSPGHKEQVPCDG